MSAEDPRGTSLVELLGELHRIGVSVTVDNGDLVLSPSSRLTPGLREAVKQNKAALRSLFDPQRTPGEGCPDHWRHIPLLPAKHETVTAADEHGNGLRYRYCLFGAWYILRFLPTADNEGTHHVEATDDAGNHWKAPSMDALYRALWAEQFCASVTYRMVN